MHQPINVDTTNVPQSPSSCLLFLGERIMPNQSFLFISSKDCDEQDRASCIALYNHLPEVQDLLSRIMPTAKISALHTQSVNAGDQVLIRFDYPNTKKAH